MKRNPIDSPCIGVCQFIGGTCRACFRTQEEAFEWYEFTDEQRQKVWDRIIKKNKKNLPT
jgi:predicted Fe-S protein YdhL (DUF1289 family)